MRTHANHKPVYTFMKTTRTNILNKLKDAKTIFGYRMNDDGNRDIIHVDYWNPHATYENQMPDILMCGPSFTIFYDELDDAIMNEDVLHIGNYRFEIK